MKRNIAGLHSAETDEIRLDGSFLVRIEWASYRWNGKKRFLNIRFVVLEPHSCARRSFSARLYCTERALWKLNWFLRDFNYDPELLSRDQVDEKALADLTGIIRTSPLTLKGHTYQNLEAFAPASQWEELSPALIEQQPEEKPQ